MNSRIAKTDRRRGFTLARIAFIAGAVGLLGFAPVCGAAEPLILTNHLGYDPFGPKRAVIRGTAVDRITACEVRTYPDDELVLRANPSGGVAVDKWRNWRFWTIDFSDVQREGTYSIECADGAEKLQSFPFKIQKNILERATISDVIYYFKGQRSAGLFDKADSHIRFDGSNRKPIDAHGGWYDATGDYGIHFSQLDFASYFNSQQVPLVEFSLLKSMEVLDARRDSNFTQIRRRLIDEAMFGADFLVRMKDPEGSFYESIEAPGPGKKPEDRRIVRAFKAFGIKKTKPTGEGPADDEQQQIGPYEAGYRGGAGFAIAGLAMAARLTPGGDFSAADYLKTAEDAFRYLEAHNTELLNDGKENIVDDYCALVAASELLRATKKPIYAAAAKKRAENLLERLIARGKYQNYWRADDRDRPFFHASDAGAPLVSLLDYYDLADAPMQARIKDAVRRSLGFELWVTNEVPNPFGLARQYVQNKAGERRTAFFYPHDTETAPWWQGEDARLASLAAAARMVRPLFADDPAFNARLQAYSADQLNWILGLNPFDVSMLQGRGRNNPEYFFFDSWEYRPAPGGIVNGITSGFKDEHGIDFNVPYAVTHEDDDWRWGEQWLPHDAWYLLAVSAGRMSAPTPQKVVIAYVFAENKILQPSAVPAEKLTHINYAFANIKGGRMVEGFDHDADNFRVLNSLKQRNPRLKVLVSVGGWTWSGNFSDMALTAASRSRFIDSAVAFLKRYKLDGLDVDWEFPGQLGLNNTHRPEDREDCTALMDELRAALDKAGREYGKRYLLTMATEASDKWLEHTEMNKVQRDLDYVNLMAYDQFEETGDRIAGLHAPLFTNPDNPKHSSAALMVSHYIAAGVPASKIVLGVPFYGHVWANVAPREHGLYQPGSKPDVPLMASYRNIEAQLENPGGFARYWDDVSEAPFLYNAQKHMFVSYEDEQSVRLKARYVVDRGMAGIMFWELSGDSKNQLLDTIDAALKP
ncbi:MAG: glycosyl hydrolase family 18 protein [Bryobacteraceae bacterium]